MLEGRRRKPANQCELRHMALGKSGSSERCYCSPIKRKKNTEKRSNCQSNYLLYIKEIMHHLVSDSRRQPRITSTMMHPKFNKLLEFFCLNRPEEKNIWKSTKKLSSRDWGRLLLSSGMAGHPLEAPNNHDNPQMNGLEDFGDGRGCFLFLLYRSLPQAVLYNPEHLGWIFFSLRLKSFFRLESSLSSFGSSGRPPASCFCC